MKNQNFTPFIFLFALTAFFHISPATAQKGGPAVEGWKSFLPYNQVNGVATDGTTFFCATSSGFFTYNREDGSMTAYSKVNGMSDLGLNGVAFDGTTGQAVLTYGNSNIDLFKDGSFTNIPDLKLSQGSGDKTIHAVIASDGLAYLSTGIGLMVLNLNKQEIKETIVFYDNSLTASVYATVISNDVLYAATSVGLFRINKNSPFIQDYSAWTKVNSNIYHLLGKSGNNVYAAESDSLFSVPEAGNVAFIEKIADSVTHLDEGTEGLWISAADAQARKGFSILRRPADGSRIDSFFTISPSQVVQLPNSEVWFGDNSNYNFTDRHGLRKKTAVDRSEPFFPNGPVTDGSFDVSAYNGEFWVAHGGKTSIWGLTYSRAMFSHFKDEVWNNYPYPPGNEWVQDFIRILKDQNTGTLYAASYSGGLYVMGPDGVPHVYGEGYLEPFSGSGTTPLYLLSGIALDANGNLWMTEYGAPQHELTVRTRDGNWYKAKSIDGNPGHNGADVIIDDYGQKWFITMGNGVVVYNDNGTVDNISDDNFRVIKAGGGSGNLPDNNTMSIAKDKDGAIWVGTANGIGIINCGDQALNLGCQAELKVVQNDQFAGYLFEGQSVKSIAVDGANRKWIGTESGVWLLSEDAEKTIYRFTEDNSPLPSNSIERINIDPITGDVYISTAKGLIAFRSTATEGTAENAEELFVYPNPVPPGFSGMIAVRGVAENADVRFTDISGQLVYRTKALGGQAVWNGKDYTGRKAQSGVYLVFIVNKDGTQKATGKFMIQN